MSTFDRARQVVLDAIAARVFPAATVDVGSSNEVLWHEAFGMRTFRKDALPALLDTPFDLASLTKVIATTTVMMELVASNKVRLDEPVATFFEEWRGTPRDTVTVRDLLEHASGMSARLVDPPPEGRRAFEHDICMLKLEYEPRTKSIYSDLGFILLGFLAADRGGASFADQFDRIKVRLKPDATKGVDALPDGDSGGVRLQPDHSSQPDLLTFDLAPPFRALAAPTMPINEDLRRGRRLIGQVHDNYAAALGGVAGHAGLFGTASAVGTFARTVLRAARGDTSLPAPFAPALLAEFVTKTSVPGSSRALGWDTMLPTSSCGTHMSPRAFGHVGFTGTSLWIDPERDRYFVLLTNRASGGGTLEQMRTVRRAFHDALGDL